VRRVRDLVVAMLTLLLGRVGRPRESRGRIVPDAPGNTGAELAALAFFGLSSCAAVGFIVAYAVGGNTQYLGLSLGLSLVFVAAALIITARKLVVTEELEDDYPP